MVRYVYVVDLSRCTGCQGCTVACKVENSTPEGMFWMHVFRYEEGEYPNSRFLSLPRPCMHCKNAPCVKVCPVGARHKDENWFTLTDFERCIGCRYCEVACPYNVNSFNWKNPKKNYYYDWDKTPTEYGSGDVKDYSGGKVPPYRNPDLDKRHGKANRLTAGGGHFIGTMEKCTWCVHRVEKGLKPACVENCPVTALYFGDIDDENSDVSKLLARKKSFRLLEEMDTEPRVYYVGGTPPSHEIYHKPIRPASTEGGR